MIIKDGTIPFKGFQTYYRIVGECEEGKLPLLVLHGGPGAAHDYLITLDDLAQDGRAVIYYDQLGCGRSKIPPQIDLWSTQIWVEEIDVVRSFLGLTDVHILGQSWGGMLSMQYAITQPKGVHSMVIASSPASMKLWESEAIRLIDEMPAQYRDAIKEGEAAGNYENPAYREAYNEYYRRHVCSLDPYPDFVDRSFSQMGEVYEVMQGKSEFMCRGRLKTWDITDQLSSITIPTLLTSGVMDEATPLIVKSIYDRIPSCRWELLTGTHLVHVEQRKEYNRLVESFLAEMETQYSNGAAGRNKV